MLGIYYKPIRVGNFWNNNYIEYESNGDINKNLSVKEYLNEIKGREREREREREKEREREYLNEIIVRERERIS